MTIELYSSRFSPYCRSVLMAGKELGIAFNYHHVELTEGEQLKPDYLKLNPAHTVPTINDNGFVLWESRAILAYLVNQYKPDSTLYPKDPKKRAIVDRWLNFDQSFAKSQSEALLAKFFGQEIPEDKLTAYRNSLRLTDDLIGAKKYLTGDKLTIADLSLLSILVIADMAKFDLSEYKNVARWQSTLMKELAYYDEINHFDEQEVKDMLAKFAAKRAQQNK